MGVMEMDNKEWKKILHENTLNEGQTFDLAKEVKKWLSTHQKMYEAFLNKLLLGKTIRATAMKYDERGHSWNPYTIEKIKDVSVSGGRFYSEISVKDKDGKYYTLSDDKIEYIK
jgi:hypothetical protein